LKLSDNSKKLIAIFISFLFEIAILALIILAWTKAGGLEVKETWVKVLTIVAVMYASDELGSLIKDKIYVLMGVTKKDGEKNEDVFVQMYAKIFFKEAEILKKEDVDEETREKLKDRLMWKQLLTFVLLIVLMIVFFVTMIWAFINSAQTLSLIFINLHG